VEWLASTVILSHFVSIKQESNCVKYSTTRFIYVSTAAKNTVSRSVMESHNLCHQHSTLWNLIIVPLWRIVQWYHTKSCHPPSSPVQGPRRRIMATPFQNSLVELLGPCHWICCHCVWSMSHEESLPWSYLQKRVESMNIIIMTSMRFELVFKIFRKSNNQFESCHTMYNVFFF
jgi:hypothetical protein